MIFCVPSIVYSQFTCGNSSPPSGNLPVSPVFCQDVSDAGTDFGNVFYVPNTNSTTLEIKVNVHVMQFSSSNPQNFTNTQAQIDWIRNMVENNGEVYARVDSSPGAEWCGTPTNNYSSPKVDAKVRLKLNQVFFRVDATGFVSVSPNYNYNTYIANNTVLQNAMNVFICPGLNIYNENRDYSGIGQGYNGESTNYVLLKPTYISYLNGNNWDAHRLLVHEVNHCIGLNHTFTGDRNSQPFFTDYKCTNTTSAWNASNHNMMYGGAMIYMTKLQNGHLRRNLLTTWRKKVLVNQSLTNGNHILTENVTINNGQLVVLTDDLYIKTGNTLTVNGLL